HAHRPSLLVAPPPPSPPLFPYTTLFRSPVLAGEHEGEGAPQPLERPQAGVLDEVQHHLVVGAGAEAVLAQLGPQVLVVVHLAVRSEEHTSELQSRENLVCRLLLEKKNKR